MSASGQRDADRAQRRDEIRGRLLRAVDQLTAGGDSYAAISVERLAGAAGLSRATFYIYFNGKGDLLRARFDDALAELRHAAEPLLDPETPPTAERWRAGLHALCRSYRAQARMMAAISDEATQDAYLRDRLHRVTDDVITALTTYLQHGQATGWVDPDLLAPETAAWITWLLERGLSQPIAAADDDRLTALADTLAAMLWHTITADGPGQGLPAR